MRPENQPRSTLERIVRFAKISAAAIVLALIPRTISSNSGPIYPKQEERTIEDEILDCKYPIDDLRLGKAVELFQRFPDHGHQIPGAESIRKIPNPQANKFLVVYLEDPKIPNFLF